MLDYKIDYTYITSGDASLFTVFLLPEGSGSFPTVVIRTPYVDALEMLPEKEICFQYAKENEKWLKRGYALVLQHCRGRGKSEGDCIPYVNEREDTLSLYAWIREQPFYNGELFLKGSSYLTSVHFCAAPFDADIRGAIFGVQDSERYNICYRNGFFKKALHGNWYVNMYKKKSKIKKTLHEWQLRDLASLFFFGNGFWRAVA